MPLCALYRMVLEHDIKVGNSASETAGLLQQKEFYQVPCFFAGAREPTGASERANEVAHPGPRGRRGREKETHTKFKGKKEAFCKACSLMSCPHLPDTFFPPAKELLPS